MSLQNVVLLQTALDTLHASGVKSHMPYVFDADTFLCCLSPPSDEMTPRIWRAHYWTAATNEFKPIATQFPENLLECAPQAYRDADGVIQFSIVSNAISDFNLHRFYGTTFDELTHVGFTPTAQAGVETATTRLTTAKFVAPQLDNRQCGRTTDAMWLQKLPATDNNPRVLIVRDNFAVMHASPVAGSANRFTLTIATPAGFTILLIDATNLMLAHKVTLSNGVTPYKAHLAGSVLFYAQKDGPDFEDRKIALTNMFALEPVPLFDYFFLANDFLYNPQSSPPGV